MIFATKFRENFILELCSVVSFRMEIYFLTFSKSLGAKLRNSESFRGFQMVVRAANVCLMTDHVAVTETLQPPSKQLMSN